MGDFLKGAKIGYSDKKAPDVSQLAGGLLGKKPAQQPNPQAGQPGQPHVAPNSQAGVAGQMAGYAARQYMDGRKAGHDKQPNPDAQHGQGGGQAAQGGHGGGGFDVSKLAGQFLGGGGGHGGQGGQGGGGFDVSKLAGQFLGGGHGGQGGSH